MLDNLFMLIKALAEPEYLYLLIEPAFIYGVGLGLLVFVCGFGFRDSKMQVIGLLAMIISAALIFPYLKLRETAEPRISKVYELESPGMAEAFRNQSSQYEDNRWVYLGLAGAAGMVLLLGARTNKLSSVLSAATVVAACGVIIYSMSMHLRGSQIHHPNLLALKQQVAAAE